MKLDLKSSNGLIVAILLVAALAVAFWMLILSPKRDEASKLEGQVSTLESELSQHTAEAEEAEEARKGFPVDYQQLVVLGKAVPGDDDTASLLVQINRISDHAGTTFQTLKLSEGGTSEAAAPPAPESEEGAEGAAGTKASLVSPTEVAASTLPLGASIGPAGLAVMPYTLTFTGGFFQIADFIKGLDSLVKTENDNVDVTGRLITVDGFSLKAEKEGGFPNLEAEFTVTTYLTPPEESATAGAAPTALPPAEATPASTTTGGAP
jgi:Tfp pilus assembly protein PilO